MSELLDPMAVTLRTVVRPPTWGDHLAPFVPLLIAELIVLGLAWLVLR